jgi:hypothetical protein
MEGVRGEDAVEGGLARVYGVVGNWGAGIEMGGELLSLRWGLTVLSMEGRETVGGGTGVGDGTGV